MTSRYDAPLLPTLRIRREIAHQMLEYFARSGELDDLEATAQDVIRPVGLRPPADPLHLHLISPKEFWGWELGFAVWAIQTETAPPPLLPALGETAILLPAEFSPASDFSNHQQGSKECAAHG